MGRLVDADKLVKLLKANTMSNGTLINTNTMLAVVEKMPTAYDVEKVVAELEEESDYEPIDYDYCDMSCSGEEYFIATDKAIDIVRKGGVE